MPRTHPPYAAEYRRRIVELARGGRSITSLAREFEPTVETIRQWVKQAGLDEGLRSDGLTTTEREELPHRRHSALDYLSPIDYERAYGVQLNFPCRDELPLKESAPPPTAAGKIEDRQGIISIKKIGESLNQSPSPSPSTESGELQHAT